MRSVRIFSGTSIFWLRLAVPQIGGGNRRSVSRASESVKKRLCNVEFLVHLQRSNPRSFKQLFDFVKILVVVNEVLMAKSSANEHSKTRLLEEPACPQTPVSFPTKTRERRGPGRDARPAPYSWTGWCAPNTRGPSVSLWGSARPEQVRPSHLPDASPNSGSNFGPSDRSDPTNL